MKNYVITCSSTCDLSPYFLRQHNIYYVSFFYYLDNNKYYDDFYKEHDVNTFYNTIKTSDVKTSQPDPNQYKELWLKLIDQGNDILHIELSSGISGAVNSALIAKSMVEDVKPDCKITVIDSLCCSTGYGLLLSYAAREKERGIDIDSLSKKIEDMRLNINHVFVTANLDQLVKGGRINKIAGGVGKILNIVPILHVNDQGKLEMIKKVRGLNNAIDEMINLTSTNILNNDKYDDMIFFTHANSFSDVKTLYDKTKAKFNNAKTSEDYIFNVGTVIGAHTGDQTFALFYIGDKRV